MCCLTYFFPINTSLFLLHIASQDVQLGSQEPLDDYDRADICVRTKAPELIGRLACVMFIYEQAFLCVHKKQPFKLSLMVPPRFVRNAEQCIRASYAHAESYTSVSLHLQIVAYMYFMHTRKTVTL